MSKIKLLSKVVKAVSGEKEKVKKKGKKKYIFIAGAAVIAAASAAVVILKKKSAASKAECVEETTKDVNETVENEGEAKNDKDATEKDDK